MGDIVRLNRIITTNPDDKIKVDSIETYSEPYVYTDFEDDDIPNVRAVNTLIAIGTGEVSLPTVRLPYPINTALPITIDYTPYTAYGNDPEIQVKYKTGQIITSSASINQGDTDSDITILTVNAASDGDPTGSGTEHTDGAIIIVIKQ